MLPSVYLCGMAEKRTSYGTVRAKDSTIKKLRLIAKANRWTMVATLEALADERLASMRLSRNPGRR